MILAANASVNADRTRYSESQQTSFGSYYKVSHIEIQNGRSFLRIIC